eukprot:6895854-Prymnesium_polylepis.1
MAIMHQRLVRQNRSTSTNIIHTTSMESSTSQSTSWARGIAHTNYTPTAQQLQPHSRLLIAVIKQVHI